MNLVDRIARTYLLFVTVHELRRCLPDLHWATVFGPPYVEMFGRERFESLGAERIQADQFLVRLTPRLDDLVDAPAEIEERRRSVRRQLGENAFFDPTLDPDHPYIAPDFPARLWSPDRAVWD